MSTDFKTKAEFFAFLDEVRWSNPNNYDEINYSHKSDLSTDEKLLTHWLCYISDRAMGYKRIWDVGGFVYSDLVHRYTQEDKIEIKSLLTPNDNLSFFKKTNEKDDFYFKSITKVDEKNIISKRYSASLDENKNVLFSPRYYPSDYVSIYYTLYTLNYLKCSFGEYIARIISKAVELSNNKDKHRDIMMCLFCGFYVLSYSNIGRPISSDLKNLNTLFDTDNNNELIKLNKNPEIRADKISEWLKSEDFIEKAKNVYDKKRFERKRIWCCIRDYLKHNKNSNCFSELMKNSLQELKNNYNSEEYTKAVKLLFSEEMKTLLELPGDTWNKKSVFRHCLLKGDAEESSTRPINKVLRDKFDNKETDVYPEQFDVSFAFVPRMCNQGNCRYCPISDDKDKGEIEKLCSAIKGQYCPAILMYTGFFYECPGKKECKLKDFI